MSTARLVVMTKAPVPGRVKTRLVAAIGAERACAVHAALVETTLDRVRAAGLPATVALDGDPAGSFAAGLVARGLVVEPQVEGDLGARMRHALRGPGRRVAIGTDIPLVEPAWLRRAALTASPVALGPAEDGGYWAIGVDRPYEQLFADMLWSTGAVLRLTVARCQQAGLAVELLPTTYDIDEPADLRRLLADPACPPALRAALGRLGL